MESCRERRENGIRMTAVGWTGYPRDILFVFVTEELLLIPALRSYYARSQEESKIFLGII